MKLISWNVNGIRACLQKGFEDAFRTLNADFFCLQETKAQPHQVELDLPGYRQYWYSAEKKGYSGTAIFARYEPLAVTYGVGVEELDHEGRLITLEYPNCFIATCYTPNAQDGLKRLDHRMAWDDAFRAYLVSLDRQKPVIVCGDLNVAHQEIDLKNPGPNRGNAGFSDEERGKFTELLQAGFTDTFRYRNPDLTGAYSWWSYRFHAREAGALTIFWCPTACASSLRPRPFIRKFTAPTTVRLVWSWIWRYLHEKTTHYPLSQRAPVLVPAGRVCSCGHGLFECQRLGKVRGRGDGGARPAAGLPAERRPFRQHHARRDVQNGCRGL